MEGIPATETNQKAMWWLDDPAVLGIGGAALALFLAALCAAAYCCFCRGTRATSDADVTTRLEDFFDYTGVSQSGASAAFEGHSGAQARP